MPHCMAHHGTDTSSWWWQEDNAPSHTSRRTKAFLKEREIQLFKWNPCSPVLSPLGFEPRQEWEPALGDRQFTSQLELRAMVVKTVSALDPEAAEKACTTVFIHRCLVCVRQRRPFRAPLVMDQLMCAFFWSRSTRLETRTKESNR